MLRKENLLSLDYLFRVEIYFTKNCSDIKFAKQKIFQGGQVARTCWMWKLHQ